MHPVVKSLFLAWQDSGKSRLWFPVGRLDRDGGRWRYRFGYTHGAEDAARKAGFQPLPAFPHFNQTYESDELFPLFQNRVLGADREDFGDYLRQLDLNPEEGRDPIVILAVSEGKRQTDNLEVFPKLERQPDGTFVCRFFIHGGRYVHDIAAARIEALKSYERLRVSLELNNPTMELALQLQSNDCVVLGWAPRYLVGDLMKAILESPDQIAAHVVRVNRPPAPANQRVLVELKGSLPINHEPMSGRDFQLLHVP